MGFGAVGGKIGKQLGQYLHRVVHPHCFDQDGEVGCQTQVQ